MNFKFLFKSLPIAFIALFIVATLSAQSDPPVKRGQPAPTETSGAQEAREDKEFSKELQLTKEQRAEFKKADDQYRAKSKAQKNAKKEDAQRLREERIRAHKAALSPEQQRKYDEILAKRDAKHQEKKGRKMDKKAEKKEVKKVRKSEKKAEKVEKKDIQEELHRH